MVFDYGTVILIINSVMLLIFAILFFFIKPNHIIGIRIYETYSSEETWHRIHVIAAYFTFPFIVILVLCMFLNNATLKATLAFLLVLVYATVCIIIARIVTKDYFKNKRKIEDEELKEQIKKESGWS